MNRQLLAALSLALASSGSWAAGSYLLDFGTDSPPICSNYFDGSDSGVACSNWSRLGQSYGDVAGEVDVGYVSLNDTPGASLMWWSTGYNDLYSVVFAAGGDGSSHGIIALKPLAGQSVTLTGFDVGAYSYNTLDTHIRVYEIGNPTALFSYDGPVGSGATTHWSFSGSLSSATGLQIDWYNSAYNVGVDNVAFSIGVVPEPSTSALMLAGLVFAGAAARRRRG